MRATRGLLEGSLRAPWGLLGGSLGASWGLLEGSSRAPRGLPERKTAEGVLLHEEVTRSRTRDGASTLVLNSKLDFHQAGVVHNTPKRITSELK